MTSGAEHDEQLADVSLDALALILGDRLEENAAWQKSALCAQVDPDSFFPGKGESPRVAKALCRKCPVQQECLEYALEHDTDFGVWGGASPVQRRRMRAERTAS